MTGCYGSSKEDRHFENKLLDHLDDSYEAPCVCDCGEIFELDEGNGCECCGTVYCTECLPEHLTPCSKCGED